MIFDLQGIHEVTDASKLREEVNIANKCYLETLTPIRQRFRTIGIHWSSTLIMCFFTCKFEPLLSPTIFCFNQTNMQNQEQVCVVPPSFLYIFWFPPGFFLTKKNDKFPKGCSPSHPTARGPGFKKLPKASLKEANTARCAGKRCSSHKTHHGRMKFSRFFFWNPCTVHAAEVYKVYMDVSKNSGFPPKSSIFNRVFLYKPSILGYPFFWKHPYVYTFNRAGIHTECHNSSHNSTKGFLKKPLVYGFWMRKRKHQKAGLC